MPKPKAPAVDTIDSQDMAASYGWSLALLKSDPSLYSLFQRAVQNNYTDDRFVAELRNTKWFQTHSDAMRNAVTLQKTDPRTWEARQNQMRASVNDMAASMGAQLSPKMLNRISNNVLYFGWNDAQIRDTLAGAVHVGSDGTFGGAAATNAEHLRQTALNNGVQLSTGTLNGWVTRLAAGESIDGFDAYVRGMAKTAFPAYAAQIDAGMNVKDIADPYIQQMGSVLQVDPQTITLQDPTIRQALQASDGKGGIVAKPLWQFENELRNDPRYDKTDQARADAATFAGKLAQTFGKV